MSAIYGISTYGQEYLLDEKMSTVPWPRHFFIFAIMSIYLATVVRAFMKGLDEATYSKPKFLITMAFIMSLTIHSVHFIDHSVRPVDCHEPKLVYQKYIWSEMEVGFLIYIFTTAFGIWGICRSLSDSRKLGGLKILLFYCFLCLNTPLAHYRIDPPWLYSALVNVHIAGDGVMGLFLAFVIWMVWSDISEMDEKSEKSVDASRGKYTPVKKEKETKSKKEQTEVYESPRTRSGGRRRSGGQIKTNE